MALTREFLRSLGIDGEKIDAIIENHVETVNALKEESNDYKTKFEEVNGYKDKFLKEEKAFKEFKDKISSEKIYEAKKGQVRDYLKEKGVDDANLNLALGFLKDSIKDLELVDDKVKNLEVLDDYLEGDLKNLVKVESAEGADIEKPNVRSEPTVDFEEQYFL